MTEGNKGGKMIGILFFIGKGNEKKQSFDFLRRQQRENQRKIAKFTVGSGGTLEKSGVAALQIQEHVC